MRKPIVDRKNAQGSITEKGMNNFELASTLILQGLVAAKITQEECAVTMANPPYKGLMGDQFLSKRACELAKALLIELKEWEKIE